MIKITIANTKGGCGKTTIATNFASITSHLGKKTILIDSDVQNSSMRFRAIRPDTASQFQAFSILTPTIHKDIDIYNADFVFVDAGGTDSRVFRSALLASPFILMPLLPSQYDLWSSEETLEIIDQIGNEKTKVGVILNMVIEKTTISKEVIDVLEDYKKKYNIHCFKNHLVLRQAYKESVSEGLGVIEVQKNKKKYEKAQNEIMALYNEVNTWLLEN